MNASFQEQYKAASETMSVRETTFHFRTEQIAAAKDFFSLWPEVRLYLSAQGRAVDDVNAYPLTISQAMLDKTVQRAIEYKGKISGIKLERVLSEADDDFRAMKKRPKSEGYVDQQGNLIGIWRFSSKNGSLTEISSLVIQILLKYGMML